MILSLQRACPKPNPAPFESSGEEGVIADNFTGTLICWSLISAVLLCDGTYGTWPQPSAEGKMIQGSSDKTEEVAFELVQCRITHSANQSRWFLSSRAGISHHKHNERVCVVACVRGESLALESKLPEAV